jgi:HD-GYP domain-containing protein (c-di-GMP phosphodiesterase class II)
MSNPATDATFEQFAGRCRALGARTWWCSPDADVIDGDAETPEWVSEVARDALAESLDGPREVGDGERAVALVRRHGSQVLDVAVVAYPAKSANLEPALRWMFQDLCASAQDAATLGEFSETLAQSYEETNLLFRLARLMNSASAPRRLMTEVCSQIQQVLPFGWVAMKFRDDGAQVAELSGKTIIAGQLPIDRRTLDRLCQDLLARCDEVYWTRLHEPGKSDLASATGAEVIAQAITHDGKVIGALVAGGKVNGDPDVTSGELQFMDAAAEFLGMFHENVARFSEQRAMFMGMTRSLVAAIDAKHPYTCGHSERVALLAGKMAVAMELEPEVLEQYRVAGLLHDVGKIGVPEAVLCKAGKLDDAEFALVKKHPEIGYHILKDIPSLEAMLPGVLHHHEQWNGGGYPHGLAGDDIPIVARVLALADTFDAMSSDRAYRDAMPRDEVLNELRRGAGVQFDPDLVGVFTHLDFSKFDQLVRRQPRQSNAA